MLTFGGGEQVLALAGALGGEIAVAANHLALVGEGGCDDARHGTLIEQRELQGTTVQ